MHHCSYQDIDGIWETGNGRWETGDGIWGTGDGRRENPELKVSTSVIGENPNIFGHLTGENNNRKTVKMEDLVPLIVGDS